VNVILKKTIDQIGGEDLRKSMEGPRKFLLQFIIGASTNEEKSAL